VTAKVSVEEHKLYRQKGPVLYATHWQEADKPEPEVATFY
jgi:hypothetical protein